MQKVHENTCAGVSFLIKLEARDLQLYLKRTLAQVLSCEFCKIFKNTYFVKQLQKAASVYCQANINLEKSLAPSDLLLIHSSNFNSNRNSMWKHPLLYVQLSLQVTCCWKCKKILKLCETFFKSPTGKKYKILIGLCKQDFLKSL